VLVLVEASEQPSLRLLTRAFAGHGQQLRVITDVGALAEVPAGATVALCVRPDDVTWLNRQRPLFADRRLRVFLWVSPATAADLRERAPDFFDWISHHQLVPPATPAFVRRPVALAGAPGLQAEGTAPDAVALLARCDVTAVPIVFDGQQDYPALVHALRIGGVGWRIIHRVDGAFWSRRVRWALAEAGVSAPTILTGEGVSSPGWLPWSAKTLDLFAAVAQLADAGVADAADVAVACELEPATVDLVCWLARASAWDLRIQAGLSEVDVGAALATLAADRIELPRALRDTAPFARAAVTAPSLRRAARETEEACKRALRRGQPCDPHTLAAVTSRARWTRPEPTDLAAPVVRGWQIEALLRGGWRSARAYLAYARVAGILGHTDAQIAWVIQGYAAPRADELAEALFAELSAAADATYDHNWFLALLLGLMGDLRVRQEVGALIGVHIRIVLADKKILRLEFDAAETLLREALTVAEASGEADLQADVCEELAGLADLRGDTTGHAAWMDRERGLRPVGEPTQELTAEDRAAALIARGDWSGAEAEARAGLATLTERDPPDRKASLLDNLATALEEQDRLEDAAEAYLGLRSHLRAHGGARTPDAFVADASLGHIWLRLGRLDDADTLLRERGAEVVQLFGQDHLLCILFDSVMVELRLARQDWVGAEAVARRLVAVASRVGPTSIDHLQAKALLGRALLRQGKVDEAIAELHGVHADWHRLWAEEPKDAIDALSDLSDALRRHGDATQAIAVLRELHATVRALPPNQRARHTFQVAFQLASGLVSQGGIGEAGDIYLQAIADDPVHRRQYLSLARFNLAATGRGAQWEAMLREELAHDVPDDRPWRAEAWHELARHCEHEDRLLEAETALRASLALRDHEDPFRVFVLDNLYRVLRRLGRLEESIAVLRELLARPLPRAMHFGDPTYLQRELADLLLFQNDYAAAELVAADPRLAGPRMFALYKQGKDRELELCARAVLDDTATAWPGDSERARLFLALRDLERGHVDAALAILNELAVRAEDPGAREVVRTAKILAALITGMRTLHKPAEMAEMLRANLDYRLRS